MVLNSIRYVLVSLNPLKSLNVAESVQVLDASSRVCRSKSFDFKDKELTEAPVIIAQMEWIHCVTNVLTFNVSALCYTRKKIVYNFLIFTVFIFQFNIPH